MQTASKVMRVLMWLTLLVCGFFQWCGIIGILINNGKSDDPYTIWPLMAAMAVLLAAVIWFTAAKNHRLPGVIAAGAASVVIFVVALDLWQTFDASTVITGGLTLWTLIWRHMSSLLVFVFMLAAYILEAVAAPKKEEKELPAGASLLGDRNKDKKR